MSGPWELSPSLHVIWGLCDGFKLPGSSVHCLCHCGWQAWVGMRVHSCEKCWPWRWRLGKIQGHTDFVCSGIHKEDFENELKVGEKMTLFLFYWGRCQLSSWDLWTYFSVLGCPFSKGIQWTVLGFWFTVTGWLVFWFWETIEAFFPTLKGRWATDTQLWRCYPFNIGSYFCDLIMSSEMCCWLWLHSLLWEFLDLVVWLCSPK